MKPMKSLTSEDSVAARQPLLDETQRSVNDDIVSPIRKGPPNRMNDLVYRDWMKFQKSFFRHTTDQNLIEECIYFFTKALWSDDIPSRSLIIGTKSFDKSAVSPPRIIDGFNHLESIEEIINRLSDLNESGNRYDFILLDLRLFIQNRKQLSEFLTKQAGHFFRLLRQLLIADRYCGVLVGMEKAGGGGFPLPWSVALSAREHLRLRDEKIGLIETNGSVFYCLFMQALEDQRPAVTLKPSDLCVVEPEADSGIFIPAWVIPKPPPRKKNEILHPAKFPETLVEQFLEIFTKPGDTTGDVMVGTGSTVLASIRTRRNSYGIELNPQFVEIARKRVADETHPMLFEVDIPQATILQGDALELGEIPALKNVEFDYGINSPPYWSMLANPGSENQKARRDKNLQLVYSESEHDLGNVADYDQFLILLESVYSQFADKLKKDGCLTVVVKNVKRNHILYPLAWDLTMRLCGKGGMYEYLGTTLWCQDDVGLKPFAVGIHWVSNILHHYCLHFRKRM